MRAAPARESGFATVLVVLALVGLLTAFVLYRALGSTAKHLEAAGTNAASFQKLHDALTRFVMLNKRLPCPASGTAHTGDADPNTATNTCNSPSGVIPWNTLGLSQSDALDPWGRYVFYRVFAGASGFTRTDGLNAHDCLDEATTTTYTLSGASNTCNSTTHENSITDFVASKGLTVNDMGTARTMVGYVLISPGESGMGAYYPGATAPVTAPSSSSKEFLNAGSGGTYWITAASAPSVPADDATHFDDVVSYAFASDVAKNARVAGRPWPLSTIFTLANAGVSTSNYNSGNTNYKIATSGGPVWVTASGDTSRNICGVNVTPVGISACTTQTNGGDKIDSNTNERLTFDFRVTRRVAIVQLTDFKATGGGDNERAQITFYNAAGTQVDQQTMTACATGGTRIGHSTLTAAADFTKVEVRAITKTGGGQSQFGVSAIMACKLSADCPTWSAGNPTNYPTGWTQPVC